MTLAPAFLISPLSRRRSLIAAALVAGAIAIPWARLFATSPEPAPRPRPAAATTLRVVHLDDAGQLVREITRHPHWKLQFGDAWFDCTAQGYAAVYTFGDGENIAWDEPDMPTRTLSLTDAEQVAMRGLPAMSAHEPYDDDSYDREEKRYVVSMGDLKPGRFSFDSVVGPRVGGYSPMGHVFDAIVTAARARYVHARLEFLGEVRATLREYGAPTVSMRRDDLTDEEIVNIADYAVSHPGGGRCSKDDLACAMIVVGGVHYAFGAPSGLPEPLAPLQRAYY